MEMPGTSYRPATRIDCMSGSTSHSTASGKEDGSLPELQWLCHSVLRGAFPDFRKTEINAVFYPYIGLTHTIRRKGSGWAVRLSDHCRHAPRQVLEAIVMILGCKVMRRRPRQEYLQAYERFRRDPAVEESVRIRERAGGRVTALSMGPPQAEEALRETISRGVDDAVLLSDRAFAGSDTWATSTTLAAAIRKLGNVDLILCGKQAVDGDTAQVGPETATLLDIPYATFVKKIESRGGMMAVITSGWLKQEISRSAYLKQKALEDGRQVRVGLNRFCVEEKTDFEMHRPNPQLLEIRKNDLEKLREERDNAAVRDSLEALRRAVQGTDNLMPFLQTAVRRYATMGEIAGVLRSVFGEYRPAPIAL